MSNKEIKGIDFPFTKGPLCFPKKANGINAIIARVKALLTTGRGEIPMRPEQGSTVQKFVFETMTPLMRSLLADEIRSQINSFVPQMTVVDVSTEVQDNKVIVHIGYVLSGVEGELTVDYPNGY